VRPDDVNRETSIDWGMNRLTEEYLGGKVKLLVWGAILNDGTFRVCHTYGSFLEKLGLCSCIAENIHASTRGQGDCFDETDGEEAEDDEGE